MFKIVELRRTLYKVTLNLIGYEAYVYVGKVKGQWVLKGSPNGAPVFPHETQEEAIAKARELITHQLSKYIERLQNALEKVRNATS
jgi:hypothetical protein